LEQACLQETALGQMLQLCEHRCGQKVKSEARVQIIEVIIVHRETLIWHHYLQHRYFQRYILGSDCLKRGWILTNYPKTVEEFKCLDMISMPPNR